MSTEFVLIPKKVFFVNNIIDKIKKLHPDIVVEKRDKNYYFVYIDEQSFKGIDLTFSRPLLKKWKIEVRNTVLSHPVEYELTNQIIELMATATKAEIFDDGDEKMTLPVYDTSKSEERFVNDARLTFQLVEVNDSPVSIFGVRRKVHFGKRVYKQFEPFFDDDKVLSTKMKEFLYRTQYGIPDFDYGLVWNAFRPDDVKQENPVVMKLLTNKENILIDKYDYILISRDPGNPIMITNEILNEILPETWTLIDEYTVVAPKLTAQQWKNFLEEAAKYDIFEQTMKNL